MESNRGPLCNDKDRCFEDVQDTFSSFMCFNGYMSHSNYTKRRCRNTSPHLTVIFNLKMMTRYLLKIQVLTWESSITT